MRRSIFLALFGAFLLAIMLASCISDDIRQGNETVGVVSEAMTGAPRTSTSVGLNLALPFDITQAHYIGQTYCPNNLTPKGNACYTHTDHMQGSQLDWNGLGDDQYAVDFVGINVGNNTHKVLATADGVVELKAWNPKLDANGNVIDPNWNSGWGLHVHVKHANGCYSHYGHLMTRALADGTSLQTGMTVKRGDQLGFEGSTGNSTGPHIHFAVHCPSTSVPGTYEPVLPEPISGYSDLGLVQQLDLPDLTHRVLVSGNGLTKFPVGTLVQTTGKPEIYLICAPGTACHIKDWTAYSGRRFWNDSMLATDRVTVEPSSVLSCFTAGAEISSPQVNSLIACGSSLYLLVRNGTSALRRKVPYLQSDARYQPLIKSWGFKPTDLVAGNTQTDCTVATGADLGLRVGTVIEEASDTNFYVVTANSYDGNDLNVPTGIGISRINREEYVSSQSRTAQLLFEIYRGYKSVIQIPDGQASAMAGGTTAPSAPLLSPFTYSSANQCGTGSGSGQGGGTPPAVTCTLGTRYCDSRSSYTYCAYNYATSQPYWSGPWPCQDSNWECVNTNGECSQVTSGTIEADPPHTFRCDTSGSSLSVKITGPIQTGLFANVSGQNVYLEYGSNYDGWSTYSPGGTKPAVAWTGDTAASGSPRVYQMTLNDSVAQMNFFLYSPDSGQQQWFNLNDSTWNIVGDCWKDGTVIRNSGQPIPPPPSTATGTISCALSQSNLQVTMSGPMQSLLVGGSTSSPTAVIYGADTDSWTVPYTSGKSSVAWNGTNTHVLNLPPSVNGFNMFLSNGTTGRWFDLIDADFDGDKWDVAGACWRDGTKIVHGAYGPATGTIKCTLGPSTLQVEFMGSIEDLLVGSRVNGPVSIQYGSNTDGWTVPYATGKASAAWNGSSYHVLTLNRSINQFNFFLSNGSGGNWFDLVDADSDGDKWTITGDCSLSGTVIVHP